MQTIAARRPDPLIEWMAIRAPNGNHEAAESFPDPGIHDFLVLNPSPELIQEPGSRHDPSITP